VSIAVTTKGDDPV
jgi:hypothetical protein